MNPGYKIKMVKVYQPVQFEQGLTSYFTDDDYAQGLKKGLNVREMEDGSVLVRSAKDMIKIGQANVAYIQYDQLAELQPESKLDEAVKSEIAKKADKARFEADKENRRIAAEKLAKEEAEAKLAKEVAEAKAFRDSQPKKAVATATK